MESEPSSTPKLSIFSFPSQSPEPPGISTPPHRTPASVPFQWEEAPGKPRACTTILPKLSSARSLELPPRLFTEIKVTNMSSPTTVLDGPYVGRSVSFSSSFRSIDRGQFGAMVCSKRDYSKERGYFGSWRKSGLKGNTDIDRCSSFVLPSSGDGGESTTKVKISRIKRSGSFLSISNTRSHLWASIYESLKQVVPWRTRKIKKVGLVM